MGTRLEISHLAPTPVGMQVRAEAKLIAVEGRKLIFAVAAHDEWQKIGEGQRRWLQYSRLLSILRIPQNGCVPDLRPLRSRPWQCRRPAQAVPRDRRPVS